MKTLLTFIIVVCSLTIGFSQTTISNRRVNNSSFELTSQIRRERQAHYTTRYGDVSYQNALKLYGTSIGVDLGFKKPLKNNCFIKPSIGYYKFHIGRIADHEIPSRAYPPSRFRPIKYRPDSLPLGYSTDKYFYENLSLAIAGGRNLRLHKNLALTTELNFTYLATFSQHYNITYGSSRDYHTNNKGYFGYLIDYKIGMQKEFGSWYLAFNLIIPVYKEWRKDVVFLEDRNERIHTLVGGCGISLTIGKFVK